MLHLDFIFSSWNKNFCCIITEEWISSILIEHEDVHVEIKTAWFIAAAYVTIDEGAGFISDRLYVWRVDRDYNGQL